MNKVILHGRMTRDAEVKRTNTGKAVASFSLAVDRPRSKDGQQTADFINCVAWEKLAENVGNYCGKGKELVIEGRLQTRSYEAQDGSKRYVTEVLCNNIEYCGKKSDTPTAGGYGEEVEEEIPF
jgi:single-strand DNA-binding protein